MTFKELEKYFLSKPGTRLDYPFDEFVATYKVGTDPDNEKIFALMPNNKDPINVNLKCDPNLSQLLRDKYESVMPGYHMNKKHWITIVLSGQLEDQEIIDLIDHSYSLVVESLPNNIQEKLKE